MSERARDCVTEREMFGFDTVSITSASGYISRPQSWDGTRHYDPSSCHFILLLVCVCARLRVCVPACVRLHCAACNTTHCTHVPINYCLLRKPPTQFLAPLCQIQRRILGVKWVHCYLAGLE